MIDADHKDLIYIINEFILLGAENTSNKDLARILLKLREYARIHFSREEALQMQIGFPFARAHQKVHEDLIQSLNNTTRNFVANEANGHHEASVAEVETFLHSWLVDHIIQNDLRMRPYADDMRRLRVGHPSLSVIVARHVMKPAL